MEHNITYRKVEETDKNNLFQLFQGENPEEVGHSYEMMGLKNLTKEQLLVRMQAADAEIILWKEKFIGVIETAEYDENSIEIRLAMKKFDQIPPEDTDAGTKVFILNQVKKHKASRVIIEVHKKYELAIKHLVASGYKLVSTINNTITFEYDFSRINIKL